MRVSGLQRVVRPGMFCLLALFHSAGICQAQGAVAGMALPSLPTGAVDAGALPGTQVVTLTLYLDPPADRASALDAFLTGVQTAGSPQYRQWMTPASFAQSFGATADQIAAVQAWATQQGLSIGTVSASGTSMSVSGTAAQMEAAMAPGLHALQVNGQPYLTNTAVPTLPDAVAANVLAIDGLDTVPAAHPATMRTEAGRFRASDLLAAVEAAVEANSSRILSIASSACVEDVDAATAAAMHLLLKQAAAEGITTLASSGCDGRGSASYPGSLAEVVSVATAPGITPAAAPTLTELRPEWQSASGLPQDGFRHEPDLTVSSLADLETAVASILQKVQAGQAAATGGSPARLGNIAATLYSMAPIPDLYTQPDAAPAGTWEAATGLGNANLPLLVRAYATGVTAAGVTIYPTGAGYTNQYTILYGGNQTYAITVQGPQGDLAPTGTVTVNLLQNGAAVYSASVMLSPGVANSSTATFQLSQLSTSPAAQQEYTVVAAYNGDGTYRAGDNGQTSLYVDPAPISISMTATPTAGTLYVGGPYQAVVTLGGSAGAGAPSGNLTITPQPGTPQTISFPQNGSNVITAVFTATVAGTIQIQGTCTTSGNYVCSAPGSASINVYKATPTISSVQATNVAAQQATLSATVTGSTGAAAPSGQVTFTTGNTTLCTTTSSTAITGPVSCQSTNFPGTASGAITASYGGDANYNSASGTGSYTGSLITTTVTLTASPAAVVVNGTVTLKAVIAAATTLNNTPISGTVTFYDGTAQLGMPQPVPAYYPTVSYPVTLSALGTRNITAKYNGDTNYSANTSSVVPVTVGPATSAVITANPTGNVTYGTPLTFTAQVTGTPTDGSNALSGSLQFNIYGTTTTTAAATLSAAASTSATATATVSTALAAGSYRVQIQCLSNCNFDTTTLQNASTYTFNITPETPTVTVSLSPNTLAGGTTVAATATITPAATATDTGLVIGGTVTFYDNSTSYGPYGVNNRQATATFTLSAAGGDNIVAVYSGDANNNSVNSSGTTSGGGGGAPVGTTTTLTANPQTALAQAVISLIATVTTTPASGSTNGGNASGTVNFYNTNTAVNNGVAYLLGSRSLGAAGVNTSTATLAIALPDGTNVISASFVGTGSFTASASTTTATVQIQDYSVAFTPTSISNLPAGSSQNVQVGVNAINGFAGQVVLGCTAPAGSDVTCTFNPPVLSSPYGFSTLTVVTTARTAAVISRVGVAGAGAAGALLLCLLLPAVRRRKLRLLAVAVLALLGTTVGCTNLVNPATGSGLGSGTPAGTLVLTITTSGTNGVTTVTHNYSLPVTVQ